MTHRQTLSLTPLAVIRTDIDGLLVRGVLQYDAGVRDGDTGTRLFGHTTLMEEPMNSPRAKLNGVASILDVGNINDALRYYVEGLGFAIAFRYADDPDNYAGVYRDGVCLHMQWQHQREFDAGTAGRLRIRINVDDPDSLFHEFCSRGLLPDHPGVRNTDWGTREFGFRDPDGNGLTFYREV